MALQSMTALANITLQSASASVTFSGIPQNYRDLILVSEMKTSTGTSSASVRFNGASSGYSILLMRGNGSDAVSSNGGGVSSQLFLAYSTEPTTTVATNSIFQILDYSATDKHKTTLLRANNTADASEAISGRYASTNAINLIEITMDSSLSFAAGSTFNLYGRIA
jgi:hypothetical protein